MTNRVKEYRARNGYTQGELAGLVHVRRETIVFLEQNRYTPSLRLAFDLAKLFGVTVESLFSFDDEQDKLDAKSQ
jgi:putative transcriptional regulator